MTREKSRKSRCRKGGSGRTTGEEFLVGSEEYIDGMRGETRVCGI